PAAPDGRGRAGDAGERRERRPDRAADRPWPTLTAALASTTAKGRSAMTSVRPASRRSGRCGLAGEPENPEQGAARGLRDGADRTADRRSCGVANGGHE